MYHSIIIGDKNTWADWYLIPSSRPVFNPPTPKTNYVDIPGADWHLDMSTVLTGDITYNGREGSLEFIVDNGHKEWHELYSEILEYLHGRFMKATLEDDPGYYYEGRFSVNEWRSEPNNSRIVIDYNLAPYKYEAASSLDDWIWDTFNFETGIVREYKDLRVDGSLSFVVTGRRMVVVPSFIVKSDDGSGLKVKFKGNTYNLPDGETRVLNIRTVEGNNVLEFIGHGTVSIDYRGGRL
jgi:hypothetical protein